MDAATLHSLAEGASRLGVPLGAPELARFERYFALLVRWNARIKLTSLTEPGDVVDKHFLDSLAIVPALDGVGELVDVGSGAGFPGLVVAAVTGIRVTVVESIQKKAAFLDAARRELSLDRVEVLPERMETLVASGRRFEAAVSRATFAPAEWIRRGQELVAEGGRLIAMIVPEPGGSVDSIEPGWPQAFAQGRQEPPYAPGRALAVFRGRRWG